MRHRATLRPQLVAMIDLHLHLDGALPLSTVRTLADLTNTPLSENDFDLAAKLSVPTPCNSLVDYLTCFALPVSLMQSAESLQLAATDVCNTLQKQGLTYAELRFAPAQHTRKGLSQREVVSAVLAGIRASTLPCGLILCVMRGANTEANLETVCVAEHFFGHGVVALDLAGAESLYPTDLYTSLFVRARQANIPFTIHAGEADGPQSVRAALKLGASRIGHGVRSIEDPALVAELAAQKIPLECCITSNIQTKAVESLAAHPLRALLAAGVIVTVNTDNPTVSRTTLADEFALVQDALAFTPQEIATLHANARLAKFQ